VPVEIPERWQKSVPAYIGLPVLQRFNLRVDYDKSELGLIPISAAISRPFRKDRSGIGAERFGNGLRVIHIAPRSPAETSGLKIGDVIVVINGRQLDNAYFKARPHPGAGPAGTHMRLVLANGAIIEFDLMDYF
jgi:predicted metalloprotease with PDZ domain